MAGHRLTAGILLSLALAWPPATLGEDKRETIFDRVVHLEREVILEIPEAPRLCDELGIAGKHVDLGDCKIFCEREGRGLPIVLVNPGPGGAHQGFHPHFSRAAVFAEIIYYDQRGCGRSDYEPGDGYSLAQAVEDLEKLREALEIRRWIVLGWSYGGLLAQIYAVEHPENLAGLVLVGASPAMQVRTGGSRQQMFISPEERQRIREIYRTPGLSMAQIVYNIHLNGDWKRQRYYRPTREDLARMARYGHGWLGTAGSTTRRSGPRSAGKCAPSISRTYSRHFRSRP
ncbi:MAG: alpha/beta hydrolase [Planctomycetota bacterium]|jgi:pimeloyl-ACP methyl ester carboxylesterase